MILVNDYKNLLSHHETQSNHYSTIMNNVSPSLSTYPSYAQGIQHLLSGWVLTLQEDAKHQYTRPMRALNDKGCKKIFVSKQFMEFPMQLDNKTYF